MDKLQQEFTTNGNMWWTLDQLKDPKSVKKLEKSKDFIITVDTVSWECVIMGQRPEDQLKPYKVGFEHTPETFTLEQIIAKLEEWKERGFTHNLPTQQENDKFMNKNFEFIRIWHTQKGYLFCSADDSNTLMELYEKLIKFLTLCQ